jgi:hypothetical protein
MNLQPIDDGNSAVTPVIGFILVFLIMILLFSFYNTTVIPNQDFEQEISHSEEVREDISKLRQAILTSSSGTQQTTRVDLGVTYGGVTFTGVHSAPTAGTLQIKQYNGVPSQIQIENALGVGGTTDKFWTGDTKTYDTQYVKYFSEYNYYQTAPNLYIDSTVFYSDFGPQVNRTILESDQSLVKGNRISLTTIAGNTTQTGYTSTSYQVDPVSASKETITITSSNTTNPLTITIPSRLDASRWRTILQNQTDENGGYITGITTAQTNPQHNTNYIQLTFKTNENYQLSMSKLYIQPTNKQTPVFDQQPAYIDWKSNDSTAVISNTRRTIESTVRDKYNNPLSGVEVVARVNQTGTNECIGSFTSASQTCTGPNGNSYQQPGEKTSTSTGEATFVYEAPNSNSVTGYTGNFTIELAE